jgi:hypothetical protein
MAGTTKETIIAPYPHRGRIGQIALALWYPTTYTIDAIRIIQIDEKLNVKTVTSIKKPIGMRQKAIPIAA